MAEQAGACAPAAPQAAKVDKVLEFLQEPRAVSDVDLAAKVRCCSADVCWALIPECRTAAAAC